MYKRSSISRRLFLVRTMGAMAGFWVSGGVQARFPDPGFKRYLKFYNLHTNERLHCQYWSNGHYDQSALTDIYYVLRDFRTDEVKPVHTDLLDLLTLIREKVSSQGEFHVISGYRSPVTNARLSAASSGVARQSLHMKGKAIDVRLPGTPTSILRQAGRDLGLGGVGYYAKSDFVQLDIGRPRQWIG